MKSLLSVAVLYLALNFCTIAGKRLRNENLAKNLTPLGIENRIVGGEIAPEGFAPYHVSIQTSSKTHFCSGVILNERWILTAGHCLMGWSPSKFLISSGTNDIWEPEAYYYPDKVIIHCNFDKPLYHNDIALIHLDTPIEFDARTQPINFGSKLPVKNSKALITGWGKPGVYEDISQDLRKVEVEYVDYKDCKDMYKGDAGVDVGHICTISTNGAGVCHGDSGAPVVSDGKLVGIVNWGEPCARGFPDVHASISFYHDWIVSTMNGC